LYRRTRSKEKGVLRMCFHQQWWGHSFFKTIVSAYKIQRKGCFKNVLPPTVVGPFFFIKTTVLAYRNQRKGVLRLCFCRIWQRPFFF
jgi:hypothetical protein